MNQQINSFLQFLATIRHYSIHTITNYRRDLTQFNTFYTTQCLTGMSLSHTQCTSYLKHLHDKPYSRKTIARKIACLRSFWHYLIAQNLTTTNPWAYISTPAITSDLPTVLDPDTMHHLLDSIDSNSPKSDRNRSIFELLYSSGIRISELVQLNLSDIDFSDNICRILGKGNKERLALFNETTKQHLHHYIQHTRAQIKGATKSTALFLNKFGARLSVRSIQRDLKIYLRQFNLPITISPHTIRHSFASALINEGASLRTVQELLGHRNITSTQRYTHLSDKKLKETFHNAHPRS